MPRLLCKLVVAGASLALLLSSGRHCYCSTPYSIKFKANGSFNTTASLLSLRRDPRLLKLPPYLSLLCIIVGIASLVILPLDSYSRRTYISENALLPGQVHTYFAGSDQNVFRAYKHEVDRLLDKSDVE